MGLGKDIFQLISGVDEACRVVVIRPDMIFSLMR